MFSHTAPPLSFQPVLLNLPLPQEELKCPQTVNNLMNVGNMPQDTTEDPPTGHCPIRPATSLTPFS